MSEAKAVLHPATDRGVLIPAGLLTRGQWHSLGTSGLLCGKKNRLPVGNCRVGSGVMLALGIGVTPATSATVPPRGSSEPGPGIADKRRVSWLHRLAAGPAAAREPPPRTRAVSCSGSGLSGSHIPVLRFHPWPDAQSCAERRGSPRVPLAPAAHSPW